MSKKNKNKVDSTTVVEENKSVLTDKANYFWFLGISITLISFIYFPFIFGKKIYLFTDIGSDSINFYYTHFVALADYFKANPYPSWSFKYGLGQSIYPFSVGSIFQYIITLGNAQSIPQLILWTEISKILIAGSFFYFYAKTITKNGFVSVIGGLLYSFSGYYILCSAGWYNTTNIFPFIPLLLWSVEYFIQNNKVHYYILALILVSVPNHFMLIHYGLFILLYYIVRLLELNVDIKAAINKTVKIGLASIISFMVGGYMLLPNLYQMINSPRGSGDASYFDKLLNEGIVNIATGKLFFTEIARFFAIDMLGNGNSFQGWSNYFEAPIFYIGLFTLMLLPLFFFIETKRNKIIWGALLAFYILPLVFPFIRYALWGFSGDYFRDYTLIVSLVVLIISIKTFAYLIENNNYQLTYQWFIPGAIFITILLVLNSVNVSGLLVQKQIWIKVFLFVLLYQALIFLYFNNKAKVSLFILICISLELVIFHSSTVQSRKTLTKSTFKKGTGFFDETIDIVDYLKKKDNDLFYRIDKDYSSGPAMHASINDAQVQNYFSNRNYTSFNQINFIKFLSINSVLNAKDEYATRWAQGLNSRPLLLSYTAHKYLLTKSRVQNYKSFLMDSITTYSGITVFKNNYALPLGVGFTSQIDTSEWRNLDPTYKDLAYLRTCIVNEKVEGIPTFEFRDSVPNFSLDTLKSWVNQTSENAFMIKSFKENHIEGTYNSNTKSLLTFSIPFDEGWNIYVNNKLIEKVMVNNGMMAISLEKGNFTVELDYQIMYLSEGMYLTIVGIALALIFVLFELKYANPKNSLV